MKKRISSVISVIAIISMLISGTLVYVGCQPRPVYITLDARLGFMQPTFCMYWDTPDQERLDIARIRVWKVKRSAEFDSQWDDIQTVWDLGYIENGSTSPTCCLTYGAVPPGYQERVKALPLEPEQFYKVGTWSDSDIQSEYLYFIIRLDGTSTPERLESH